VRIDVDITTPDGRCPATLHVPDGAGPWPGVVLFPDAFGTRETIRAMADRLAGLGYVTVAATASFHGGRLAVADDPESPHLAAARIRATVYVAGATDDHSFPPEQAELLDRALTEAAVPHVVEFYPARHGFAVPDNPSYDPAAEERHWAALAQLFGSALRPSAAPPVSAG